MAAAAKAYGDPGKPNGVTVNVLSDKAMNDKYRSTEITGYTSGGFDKNKQVTNVDIRGSLKGQDMRQTIAHEGTHVSQRGALASTFNPKTGNYSAAANLTVRQMERQAYSVGQHVMPYVGFTTRSQLEQYITDHYGNPDTDRMIPVEQTE